MMRLYPELTTPAAIVDLDRMERNVAAMAAKLTESGIGHRPHIKSHKSLSIARKQLEAGAIGITAAKLSEAETFAAAGFSSILIAYPLIGADKLERFAALHERIEMIAVVDSMVGADGLSAVGVRTGKPVQALVEIDGGLHRGGRQPGEDAVQFALAVQRLPGIEVAGVMGYFGTIYKHRDEAALRDAVRAESDAIKDTVARFRAAGLPVRIVSTGSTPAAAYSDALQGVTEVRAGNYIFYDATAVGMGIATEEQCALRVVATVVSAPMAGRATIDAGTKTLTSDKAPYRDGFGIVVGRPDVLITGLNEEHGYLQFPPEAEALQVGDRVEIIPNHACVIPNLCDRLAGVRRGEFAEWIAVDARGCNY